MTEANERTAAASEWRALIAIAVPVVVVQVGMMLMGTVDTLMVGHVSANALADRRPTMSVSTVPISIIPTCTTTTGTAIATSARHSEADAVRSFADAMARSDVAVIREIS